MIRILHLTDFHLNNSTLKDWNDYYKEAFFEKIDYLQKDKSIDLVLFTGDLLDRAGKDFGSVTKGLNEFETQVINPILERLNIDISKFIICPGNHDIDRNADDKFYEAGLSSSLNSINEVNLFINNGDDNYSGIERIKEYKIFEFALYKDVKEKEHSKFKFSTKINVANKTIGISSLNTSWRCYNDDDSGKILLGENQLNDNYKYVEDCDIKIALMHHQLDWLSEVDRNIIEKHMSKRFDIVFSGHVHKNDTQFIVDPNGVCLYITSPSGLNQIRENNKDYFNGFTVIDYGDEVKCSFFKYIHDQIKFVKNTDIHEEGVFKIDITSKAKDSTNINSEKLIMDDFLCFLNDSGANFTHRSKNLQLDDLYVFPLLDQFSLMEQEEKNSTISTDEVFSNIISDNTLNVIFSGEENSGKTSLCKQLYKKLLSNKETLPVYIRGRDIKKVSDKDIENLINKECRNQYKNDCISSGFRKVIIVDDFNNCGLPHKSKKTFINYLYKNNIQTVITWNELFTLSELLESQTITFEILNILKFGTKKRRELIRKWVDLFDEELQNDNEKEFQINELTKMINSVIGINLVPSLPIYILTILQSNELTTNTDFEQSTFGHYYDVLIKSAIGQKVKDNKEIEKYYSYLTELAYKVFENKDLGFDITENSMFAFHQEFVDAYRIQTSFREAIETLEGCNLISENNNTYRFKYKYIYFYFIGKYLSDNIEEDQVKATIKELSNKLYRTDSSNIYLFLSHHSKSKFVMHQILESGKELFDDQLIIEFNDDIDHINKLINDVTERIDLTNDFRIDELENEDHIRMDLDIPDENYEERGYEEIDSISQVNKAFKTIEILGYIIKNRYASLRGDDKEELVEELYKLGLRSLTFLFKTLLEGEEYIRNEIIDIIRKDPNSTLTSREREGLAKQFMFNLLYMVSYSVFKKISTSISSKDLELTFRDVKKKFYKDEKKRKNNAVNLIDMAIVFEYSKTFPDSNVEAISKDLKNNPLAFQILRRLGVNYMRLMPMKESEQQRASHILDIPIQKQRYIVGTSAIRKK